MVRRLLKSLLKESAYQEPTEAVTLIETHVSYIFLTDQYVYKVKKPVDFGFLNFTTLDRRRFYCEEEVRLNRRLCPDIYLGVVELHETPQGGSFAAGGQVIDYAVKMKRLPEERILDHMVATGAVDAPLIAGLARFLAAFHARAARGPDIDACGTLPAVSANWQENFQQAAPFCGETLPPADITLIRGFVEGFLADNAELFERRVRDGFIRECDGDLHLGNICMTDRICIFDCIEFNESFRYTDTAADIAFLLMDLEYAGHPELCRPFLDAYRQASGDRCPPKLVNFYQAQRAFVRGKVTSFRLREPGLSPQELAEAKRVASRYFRLSRGYALRERLAPALIVTCGLMGSGKSTLARELAFQLGLPLAQSDAVRKQLPGAEATRSAAAGYDEGLYSDRFNRATYDELLRQARESLARGEGIIVDATFRRDSDRDRFRRLAGEFNVPCTVLETVCPEELIRERLEKRRLDRNELSDGRWELFPRQRAEYEPPKSGEAVTVDSALPLAEEIDRALTAMGLLP